MASYLTIGEKLARQALVEKPVYVADDSDLDPSFFPNGAPSAAPPQRTFRTQYLIWIEELRNRACDPVAPSTLANFISCAKTILSVVGPVTPLEGFKNQAMAQFVRDVRKFNWAPATLSQHILVIKLIIASAMDAEGEQLFPRKWNRRIINAARVDPAKQHRPCLSREDVETLISKAKSKQEAYLYAFLAGSGLRISEAQAVRLRGGTNQSSWNPDTAVVAVRTGCFRGMETGRTKTSAGTREVIICKQLNEVLLAFATSERRADGAFLFQGKDGKPFRQSTLRDQMVRHVQGAAPHSCRRFRNKHFVDSIVPVPIIKHQMGHSKNSDMTEKYYQPNEQDIRAQVERVGLGFEIGE